MSLSARQLYLDACTRAVQEAKIRLTLADLWDMAPHATQANPPPSGHGVVRSPLREDRTPSFSIFDHGKAFSDKARADVKGGVWEFVQFCRPQIEAKEVARLLVERAGLRWPEWSEFAGAGAPEGESDEARAKRLREERLARKKAEEAQLEQAEHARRAERDGLSRRAVALEEWPACVAERWREGAAASSVALVAKLCAKRGWPEEWADMLWGMEAMAFPLEPWCEPGAGKARRMVAFKVDAPRVVGGSAKLTPVGYHQKFYALETQRSGWRFLPSSKRPERAQERWSSYERAVVQAAKERGAELGKPMIPPLPFVVGQLERPRLVIILEGQWDALTMLGALGGLHPDGDLSGSVAIFGIRGVNGTAAFIDYWGAWLREVKPLVWLLPDNDGAKTGGQWFPPARAAERKQGVVYLSERLGFMGAPRVVVTPLRADAGTGGKDFNDYYRAARPDRAAMNRWMNSLKLL